MENSKNDKPWKYIKNHENQPEIMKIHRIPKGNHENQPKIVKKKKQNIENIIEACEEQIIT